MGGQKLSKTFGMSFKDDPLTKLNIIYRNFIFRQIHHGDGQSIKLEPQHNGNGGRILPPVLHVSYLSGFPEICEQIILKIY